MYSWYCKAQGSAKLRYKWLLSICTKERKGFDIVRDRGKHLCIWISRERRLIRTTDELERTPGQMGQMTCVRPLSNKNTHHILSRSSRNARQTQQEAYLDELMCAWDNSARNTLRNDLEQSSEAYPRPGVLDWRLCNRLGKVYGKEMWREKLGDSEGAETYENHHSNWYIGQIEWTCIQ